MCCTLRPAHLSKTILYAGEAERDGRTVHVLGYMNRARNKVTGPNAMILPFPAAEKMGPANALESQGCKFILKNMADAIQIHMFSKGARRGGMLTLGAVAGSVQVFDSGMYTVVLADNARDIPHVLDRVPEHKRPEINEEIFGAYAELYPECPIALCCFEANKDMDAEPLLWWYTPKNPSELFAPALDAHDGHAPDLKAHVSVDHDVVFGSTITPRGVSVRYREQIPSHIAPFIPMKVVGHSFQEAIMRNGDFSLPIQRIQTIPAGQTTGGVQVNRKNPLSGEAWSV